MPQPVRVLIIDDSALVRRLLSMGLSMDPGIEVMGAAASATEAWALMQASKPDVITLDVEMPATDGVTFLSRYMQVMPVPTVIISSLTSEAAPLTLQAMEAGAVDVIEKPSVGLGDGLAIFMREVCERVRMAAQARPVARRKVAARGTPPTAPKAACPPPSQLRLVVLGSSTGGVQALARILPMFPPDGPPIVIVQHMPAGFTGAFARRLDGSCGLHIREAADGDELQPGTAYIAPGGVQHLTLRRLGRQGWRAQLVESDPVCFSRPSVDVLFQSVARDGAFDVAAAVLTGMGRDGAAGLLALRNAGARTFAQDEATSVVFGMPFAAADLGAAQEIVALDDIPDRIIRSFRPVALRAGRI